MIFEPNDSWRKQWITKPNNNHNNIWVSDNQPKKCKKISIGTSESNWCILSNCLTKYYIVKYSLQGMLQLGPPKCTFGSGRDTEPRICAPVMLGK